MKDLVAKLMNHGFSEDQALAFIGECYNEFERLNEIFKWPSHDAVEEVTAYCANDVVATEESLTALVNKISEAGESYLESFDTLKKAITKNEFAK